VITCDLLVILIVFMLVVDVMTLRYFMKPSVYHEKYSMKG